MASSATFDYCIIVLMGCRNNFRRGIAHICNLTLLLVLLETSLWVSVVGLHGHSFLLPPICFVLVEYF